MKGKRLAWTAVRVILTAALLGYVINRIEFRDTVTTLDGRVWHGSLVSDGPGMVTLQLDDGTVREWPVDACRPVGKEHAAPGLLSLVGRLDLRRFLLFYALFIIPIVVDIWRWQILLRVQGIAVGFWRALQLTWIGLFASAFLPGITGGDVVKAVLVARSTHSRRTAAVLSVFLDRVVGLVALAFLAGVILAFHLTEPDFRQAAIGLYGFIAASVIGGVAYFAPVVRNSRLVRWALEKLPFQEIRREVDEAFHIYRDHPWAVLATFGLSLGAHFCWCFMAWGFGTSLGITAAGWHHYFIYVPVIMIVSALPISVGGWGVGEAVYVHFFEPIGVAPAAAVALSVLGRLVALSWNIPGGRCSSSGGRIGQR
ncbi:MAG: flippase-like domain-containing protein [Planctomycetes bacterium]|nr:flippase-like domain-containing protein [Planctomycetota bacterium]